MPYVGSLGACDMVNFWGRDTVPAAFDGRTFHRHNANVTLMRTSPDECRAIGEWIGRKLARCEGPVRFLIPEKGVSALDIEGGVFWDPVADSALFEGVARSADWSGERRLIRAPYHINDPAFAQLAVAQFRDAMAANDPRHCNDLGRNAMSQERFFINPQDVDAFGFDWGRLAVTVGPEVNGAKQFSGRRRRPARGSRPFSP